MKKLHLPFSLFISLLLFTACPKQGTQDPVFDLGKPFSIAQGQTMQTTDHALSIHFDKVSADSRCPQGVQCIWAGRADAVFTLKKGATSQTITLASGDFSQGGTGQATFSGYTITLNDIAPPKNATGEIAQKDYVATITVTQ